MESFPRGSKYLNHMIRNVPQLFVCAECRNELIYQCRGEVEEIVCGKNAYHQGLLDRNDIIVHEDDSYLKLKQLIADPEIARVIHLANAPKRKALYE